MKASEIMTRHVVSVGLDASVSDVARVMIDRRISAVPVINQGKIVGIDAENDLLRRAEVGADGPGRDGSSS